MLGRIASTLLLALVYSRCGGDPGSALSKSEAVGPNAPHRFVSGTADVFGKTGTGYAREFVHDYLEDVSLTGSDATSPPSVARSASLSTASSATPSSTPYACDNGQFATDQSEFAAGTITADQPVDICGSVTNVLAEKNSRSGEHGYFYVGMPSGYQIKIVSNLDAMAQAPTDPPPATWPWVAVGNYVYVQGRYYYDNSSSQGVDWTEDDTDNAWSHLGYVAVCDSAGESCSKYW